MNEPVQADKLFDPNGPDPATDPPLPERAGPDTTGLGTLMRIAVGGAALALQAMQSATEPRTGDDPPWAETVPESGSESSADLKEATPALRHTLIGAAFEAGDRIDRRAAATMQRTRRVASPAVGWARKSRLTTPIRRSYRRLASRLDRWQARGLIEEQQGRAILNTALDRSVDTTLDYVVDSPQVQDLVDELVAAESLALSQQVFVEVRGRAVSADLYDAHLIHSVLRHPSPKIPPPPRRVTFAGDVAASANLRGRTAGFVSRLAALVTDIVIISILIRAAGWLLDDVRLATGIQIYIPELTDAAQAASPIHLTALGSLLISVIYFLFFWTMGGQTPGKALLGLRVVTRSGGRLSFWRSLVRFFGYWLSSLLFGLGFLWASVDNYREGLHDKLAGTSVVYAWDARADQDFLAGRIESSQEP
jgi:uncharacterized RDD family membrane protein YckC